MKIPFDAATLGTVLGMTTPMLQLIGVDTRTITMDKAEDGAAISLLGVQLQELGDAMQEKLGDGTVDPGDLPTIFAEAADIPAVIKALGVELKDQRLKSDDDSAEDGSGGAGESDDDTPTDPPAE